MKSRSILGLFFLAIFGCALVFATPEIPPEPCFRCPASISIDDASCGTGLNRFFYFGNWEHCNRECTPGDYLCTESSTCDCQAYAKLTFVGNRVRLYAAVGPWGGKAVVKVDYQNPTEAYFCSDTCQGNKLVFDSGLLPYGRHTLLIANESEEGKKITIDRAEIVRYPNLIQNPSFEEKCASCPYDEQAFPPRWTADSERTPVTLRWDCEVAHTGSKSFFISSECPNDAAVFQNVHVRRHTNCLISAYIKTNNVECGVGANVSPITTVPPLSCVHSCGLFGNNDWTQRFVTFNTCENDVITVAGRLGFFNEFSTGCAWFDDFEFICEDI